MTERDDRWDEMEREARKGKMTLGEVINRLSLEDPQKVLAFGFSEGGSYRGHYNQLAFHPEANVSVGRMLAAAQGAVNNTLYGWKGGEFDCGLDTVCNIAESGVWKGDEDSLTLDRLNRMLEAVPCEGCRLLALKLERADVMLKSHRNRIQDLSGELRVLKAGFEALGTPMKEEG